MATTINSPRRSNAQRTWVERAIEPELLLHEGCLCAPRNFCIGGDTLGTFLRVNLSSVIDLKDEVLLGGTQCRFRFDGILTTFLALIAHGLRRFL